jgi:hypothetical protein
MQGPVRGKPRRAPNGKHVLLVHHHGVQRTGLRGGQHHSITRTGFDSSSWLPQQGWTFTGGDYAIAVLGDRFLIGERKKIRSLDELHQMLQGGQPPRSTQ